MRHFELIANNNHRISVNIIELAWVGFSRRVQFSCTDLNFHQHFKKENFLPDIICGQNIVIKRNKDAENSQLLNHFKK